MVLRWSQVSLTTNSLLWGNGIWLMESKCRQKLYHLTGTTAIGIYKEWYECMWVHQIWTLMWSNAKDKFWDSNLVVFQILVIGSLWHTVRSPTCNEDLQRGCVAILLCNYIMHSNQYSIHEGYMDARRKREIKCHSLSMLLELLVEQQLCFSYEHCGTSMREFGCT